MEVNNQVLFGLLVVVLAGLYPYLFCEQKHQIETSDIKDVYDYVVVGAGSAGSVVASRLSEDQDKTVLLLEAGGHFDESPLFNIPSTGAALLKTEYDWEYYTEKQTQAFKGLKDNKGYWPRGRVLGGSSAVNNMQYTRGSSFDFDEWAANGCDGWSYEDVLPYFLKMEDIHIESLKDSPYHSSGGPIAVSSNQPKGLTSVFLNAGKELGYEITDYNGKHQEGFSIVQNTIRNGVRSSTGLEYLGRKGIRDNLNIAIRSLVTKVDIKENKAVGVFYIRNNKKYYVKARKEVILSAGVINSPQLLMLSGVGPKNHLEDLGIEVIKDLPVGQYLKDHQLVILPSRITKPVNVTNSASSFSHFKYEWFKTGPLSETGLDGSAFIHLNDSQKGKSYPDIQMIFFNFLMSDDGNFDERIAKGYLAGNENMHGFTIMICLTHPYSTGSIKLRSADPFDFPIIDPQFFTDQRDIKQLIGGIRIWERLIETQTFKDIGVDMNQLKVSFCTEFKFRTDEFWECFIRHVGLSEYHHSCTCRMGGNDDPLAVLDSHLRVKGVSGLRVVDSSAFHNVTSGNINAQTIMLAEKAADLIRNKDTVQKYRKQTKDSIFKHKG